MPDLLPSLTLNAQFTPHQTYDQEGTIFMSWDLVPGQQINRPELHARYGGRLRSRISPSKQSPNVMLFVTPGAATSALDGWTGEHFHFGGEGKAQPVDQTLIAANGTILHHEREDRTLRLFVQRAKTESVQYLGEYRLDPQHPYVQADMVADPRTRDLRRAFIFCLLPLNGPPSQVPLATAAVNVPTVERTEPGMPAFGVRGGAEPSAAQEAANHVLLRYERYLRFDQGSDTSGIVIREPGSATALRADLYDHSTRELIMARASTARPAIWEALGELDDLTRFLPSGSRRALLLPAAPEPALAELLKSRHVTAIWPSGADDFTRSDHQAA